MECLWHYWIIGVPGDVMAGYLLSGRCSAPNGMFAALLDDSSS